MNAASCFLFQKFYLSWFWNNSIAIRLLELYFKYKEEVQKEDLLIKRERAKANADEDDEDDEQEAEYYMRRLDSGLFALQFICYIIMDISVSGPSGVSKRVKKLLNLRNEPKTELIAVVSEYKENLGEDESFKSEADCKEEHQRIEQLIADFQQIQ